MPTERFIMAQRRAKPKSDMCDWIEKERRWNREDLRTDPTHGSPRLVAPVSPRRLDVAGRWGTRGFGFACAEGARWGRTSVARTKIEVVHRLVVPPPEKLPSPEERLVLFVRKQFRR